MIDPSTGYKKGAQNICSSGVGMQHLGGSLAKNFNLNLIKALTIYRKYERQRNVLRISQVRTQQVAQTVRNSTGQNSLFLQQHKLKERKDRASIKRSLNN